MLKKVSAIGDNDDTNTIVPKAYREKYALLTGRLIGFSEREGESSIACFRQEKDTPMDVLAQKIARIPGLTSEKFGLALAFGGQCVQSYPEAYGYYSVDGRIVCSPGNTFTSTRAQILEALRQLKLTLTEDQLQGMYSAASAEHPAAFKQDALDYLKFMQAMTRFVIVTTTKGDRVPDSLREYFALHHVNIDVLAKSADQILMILQQSESVRDAEIEALRNFLDHKGILVITGTQKMLLTDSLPVFPESLRLPSFPRNVFPRRGHYYEIIKFVELLGKVSAVIGDLYEPDLLVPDQMGIYTFHVQSEEYTPYWEKAYYQFHTNGKAVTKLHEVCSAMPQVIASMAL